MESQKDLERAEKTAFSDRSQQPDVPFVNDNVAISISQGAGSEKLVPRISRGNKFISFLKLAASFLIGQWLLIGMGIACLLAYLFPHVAARGGVIRSQYSILYGAVAIIFLISGLQITRDKLVYHVTSFRLHIITQVTSFLIIPTIFLAIIEIILAANGLANGGIDVSMLVGLVALSSIPTTIASNVVFTRTAGGDDAAAMVEVMIGNGLGPFITPSLIMLFMPRNDAFDSWSPSTASGLGTLYRNVFRQIGLSVLLPLAVGQLIQWIFPKQTKWAVTTLYLAKFSTFCLILLVWSTLSSCFESGAFQAVRHTTIICDIFLNVGLYLLFTMLCFYFCRPPRFLKRLNPHIQRLLPKTRFGKTFQLFRTISKKETVAVCFCGAAKTTGLGIPMVNAMWRDASELKQSLIEIPVVLYTTEQIFFAQALLYMFKRWIAQGGEEEEEEEPEQSEVTGIGSVGT